MIDFLIGFGIATGWAIAIIFVLGYGGRRAEDKNRQVFACANCGSSMTGSMAGIICIECIESAPNKCACCGWPLKTLQQSCVKCGVRLLEPVPSASIGPTGGARQ